MNVRELPVAVPAIEPHQDRRIDITLGYPWLVQRFPRSPIAEDTLVPEDWPDLGPILDLMDL
jgi:hypothetical protein